MRDGIKHPTSFVEASRKGRSSIELSNNISERRYALKANEAVSERSERTSVYTLGYISKEPSGKLLVYPQYSILFITISRMLGFSVTAQVTELVWFNFSKTFSCLVGSPLKIISENSSICCHITEYSGKYTFFENEVFILMTTSSVFHHFGLRYPNLIFTSACFNIRANSE